MAHPSAKHSFICFASCVTFFTIVYISGDYLGYTSQLWGLSFWGPALYFVLFSIILRYSLRGVTYEVAIRSTFLGYAFSTGVYLTTRYNSGYFILGLYIMIMSAFHFGEFITIALTNPKTLSIDSFILNHSLQYGLAALASWIEWAVEFYFFPSLKELYYISYIGVGICIAGEILRKGAMFNAKTNFNHIVQFVKEKDHELVTSGFYSFVRHPSYVGWFYWSIGTQLVLVNPLCTVLYAFASWSFFNERIFEEEYTLIQFFGQKYIDYQKCVSIGLPFIKGYVVEE